MRIYKSIRLPIEVTEEEIMIYVNNKHSLKILLNILCIFQWLFNDFIPSNAFFPIKITEDGIMISLNDENPLNA